MLRLVAALLMLIARRAAAAALDRAAARDRQHPPARRADGERRALARPRPRAARHRDRDRRQPAPPVHGGAAREGAVVLLPRHPGAPTPSASTPSSTRSAPRATLERVPMLRGRIVAANGVPAEELKPPPSAAWVLQSDRGITYRGRSPGRLARRRRRMVDAGLSRARRWSRSRRRSPTASASSSAIRSPSTCSAAISRRASPTCARSTGRASASISCMVFSPGDLPRRAGDPHRDAHLSGRQHRRGGDRAAQGGGRGVSRRSRRCGCATRSTPFGSIVTNLVLAIRGASALTLLVGRAGARRRAGGRPPPPGLRRGGAQDPRRDARPAHRSPMRSNTC